MGAALSAAPPWQLGLATTVLAGVLLWAVTGRLRLRPETRAASTALFACGALLAQVGAQGVDGRATLLLAAAAIGAAAGRRRRWRTLLAVLACLAAVAVAPVVGVGLLVLLGAMALTRDLAARLPAVARNGIGWSVVAAGGGLAALLGVRGAAAPAPATVPPTVAAVLVTAAVLVGGVLWVRLRWARPAVAAVAALAACLGLPGAGPAAVLPVAAGIAVLGAVLVEEHRTLVARPAPAAAAAAVLVVAAGLLPALWGPPAVSAPAPAPGPPPDVRSAADPPLPQPAPRVRPLSFAIPALDLAGPLGELRPAENGELLAPDDPGLAGWYAGGVVPGDVGPAVIGGHVDSRRGPGVFAALRSLEPGDTVSVTRSDGSSVRFAVTRVQEMPKAQFPTEAVYAPTPRPELRLVTCGGRFDRAARSYTDNVVVDAVAVTDGEVRQPVRSS